MTKSDLLDKIKVLLKKMQDHDLPTGQAGTPQDVTSKEELGPLLKDAEELLETVSVLKYLIEEEEAENVVQPEVIEEVIVEPVAPEQEVVSETPAPIQEESIPVEPAPVQEETIETTVDTEMSAPQVEVEQGESTSVNDSVAPSVGDASVAHKLEKDVVHDLQSAIGLNERYLFINELFDGDGEAYNAAIQQLDSFLHLPEALKYVRAELSGKYNWDQEEESTISFYSLIERRYAN